MAAFTVRVELHKASSGDYDELHKKMEADGFSRTIVGRSGTEYHLPTAEYDYEHKTMTASEVVDKACAVASGVKGKPAVFVTQAETRSWKGLDEV